MPVFKSHFLTLKPTRHHIFILSPDQTVLHLNSNIYVVS